MKCRICQVEKLSREFPRETITPDCEHPPFYCLRCVTNKVRSTWKCPYANCKKVVPADSDRLKDFETLLNFLFPPIVPPAADLQSEVDTGDNKSVVHVTTLTGDTEPIQFSATMTVMQFKKLIKDRMKVETNKQRLVYREKEIETHKTDGSDYKLSEFEVKPNSTIHLMVLLYAIPETFNHVIFDLSWHYPASGRDFLDASCLLFVKDEWYSYTDWRVKNYMKDQVWHSGDEMNDRQRIGHHKIEAKLKNIPKCVSHLVFVLSSFKSPSIGHFPEPTLKFYDAADTDKDLVQKTYTRSVTSQALIVCCVSRTKDNRWMIYQAGNESAGNAQGYHLTVSTIKTLINSGVFPGVSLEYGKSLIRTMSDEEYRQFKIECAKR